MPRTGVKVSTALSAGRRNNGVPSARYHIAGVTERGPVNTAQRVTSIAEFESIFGNRTPKSEKTYNDARLYFAEGGSELFVTRVVGKNATKGFASLSDSSGVPTLRVELNEPGEYSALTKVKVEAGAGDTFVFSLYQQGQLRVRFAGVTSPADLLARTLGHPLITVTDLGSISAALAAVSDTTRRAAVSVPDLPADVIGEDLIKHAANYQQVAILSGEENATDEELATIARDLTNVEGSSDAGLFAPYVILPDEGNTGSRYVAPNGYIAAVRARAHTAVGYWQIPAGERAAARAITGLKTPMDTRRNDALADAYVNGIIQDGGTIKLYNWWSLSPDRANFQYLSVRDELNNICMDLAEAFLPFIFSTWDSRGKLLNQIASAAKGVLATLADRDAISPRINPIDGSTIDNGYTINVDAPSGAFVEENTILVRVEVRTPQTAQLILTEVVRVPLDAVL